MWFIVKKVESGEWRAESGKARRTYRFTLLPAFNPKGCEADIGRGRGFPALVRERERRASHTLPQWTAGLAPAAVQRWRVVFVEFRFPYYFCCFVV